MRARRRRRPEGEGRVLSYPNAITVLRLPLAVAFLLAEGPLTRAIIVAAGGASDWLDGWLARRLRQRSGFGELVDPIADKVFLFTVLATFHLEGTLALWELLLLLVRDLSTVLGWMIAKLLSLRVRFRSRPAGKATTVLQVVTALLLVVRPSLADPLVWATGLVGAVAVVDYVSAARGALRAPGRGV